MPKETEEAINKVLLACGAKYKLQKGLGMTEITSAATATYPSINEIGSVGIPLVKMICKIVDPDTHNEKEYLEEGEICIAGPTVMKGYYNNSRATDELIKQHEDGLRWVHTGDLGFINEDGVIFVTGRIKRIIMTKGKDVQLTKMFPDRIEKTIYTHKSVELCCVIGIADQERINYPKAFIVLKDKVDIDKTKNEILKACHQNLPGYMVPEEIVVVDNLPRTSRGKIDYRTLDQET